MEDLNKYKKAELIEKLNTAYNDINNIDIIKTNLQSRYRDACQDVKHLVMKVDILDRQVCKYKVMVYIGVPIALILGLTIGSFL